MSDESPRKPESPPPEKLTLLQTVGSVLASFFGVQSSRNRQRDFKKGNPALFIGIAIVATGIFVMTLLLIVRAMLKNAGM
jgi:hypothetical protein